jgi:Ca2+/H+ antiporter
MLGIILSVAGSVGVMAICALLSTGEHSFYEARLGWLVFYTILLSIGLIMAIHGLKKKQCNSSP